MEVNRNDVAWATEKMKKILFLLITLAAMALPSQAAQRELVIKLKDGTQRAYHLTSDFKQIVTMKSTAETITLNGDEYAIADIEELRIYEQVPEGAEVIDAISCPTASPSEIMMGYDLNGRQVMTSKMKRGLYIINRQKVLVK